MSSTEELKQKVLDLSKTLDEIFDSFKGGDRLICERVASIQGSVKMAVEEALVGANDRRLIVAERWLSALVNDLEEVAVALHLYYFLQGKCEAHDNKFKN